ncbi:unnamed protein product [Prunus brigantina]
MCNLRRVLERQERKEEEIRRIRAEEEHELDKKEEEIVCMLNESRQHHCRRAPNVGRHRHSWASFDTRVWHAFFGVVGSQNDLNVLGQSPVFNDVLRGHSPYITYQINNTVYLGAYYLADGIYPRGVARMLDVEVLQSIMMICIILHNMIVGDEYDYDAPEVFEPDPMNTTLTRIYKRPMGANGQPMKHELLIRDG